MNVNGKIVSRVYKVGYAQTSYQECPVCKQTIQKSDFNIINEEIVQYPVSKVTLKKYFHFQCYNFNQFVICNNKNKQVEQAEGYQMLLESDQKRFSSLINNYVSKLNNNNTIETINKKVPLDNAQHQKTLNDFKVMKNGLQRIVFKDSNLNSKPPVISTSSKIQSCLQNLANKKQETYNHSSFNSNKNFIHVSSIPENPMKQQVLAFKPASVVQEDKKKVSAFDQVQKKIGKEKKSLQQKMESFKFDKNSMKQNPQKSQEALDIKQQDESSSEDEEYFVPKSLNTKRNYAILIEDDEDEVNDDSDSDIKIDPTKQKLAQYIYQRDTQKDIMNINCTKNNLNIIDPKKKKIKATKQ